MKKVVSFLIITVLAFCLVGCSAFVTSTDTSKDIKSTISVGDKLASNQSTPTDIDYSLERYNLIRRAYWVNGQREKANSLVCSVEKPLGYIALFLDNGACVGKFIVDGKVTSLNSYLTPDSEFYEKNLSYTTSSSYDESYGYKYSNKWLPDVDGSYGENDDGIFFFTPDGKYIEFTGTYLYSDIPFEVNNVVVTYKEEK